ncbi:TPA: tail fiber assembly protein [Escherichia coli]|nr:tail fiber assembly protein [Escherichia coli]
MTVNYFYSSENNAFYAAELRHVYLEAGSWPNDALEVTDECFSEFTSEPPEGKKRAAVDGIPCWVDIPPPSHEDLIAAAINQKRSLISEANDYMNGKQWPGKAALGRLTGPEKEQYNIWLDYLDALEAIDTSSAPDINWPELPEA